jgi:hypothetical protein
MGSKETLGLQFHKDFGPKKLFGLFVTPATTYCNLIVKIVYDAKLNKPRRENRAWKHRISQLQHVIPPPPSTSDAYLNAKCYLCSMVPDLKKITC